MERARNGIGTTQIEILKTTVGHGGLPEHKNSAASELLTAMLEKRFREWPHIAKEESGGHRINTCMESINSSSDVSLVPTNSPHCISD